MQVRIYKPAKSAMQSGRAASSKWLLEYEPRIPRQMDPIMGWTSSDETSTQLQLWFDCCQDAIDYARDQGLQFTVENERTRRIQPKAYSDNFANDRLLRWTH